MEPISESFFADRLAALRMRKNVSAREMSLALGQNPSYINRIENGQVYPSMQGFFYICEYLQISPSEFFNEKLPSPQERRELTQLLDGLSERQIKLILALVRELSEDDRTYPLQTNI